jgi:hypothetical protein
MLIALGALLFAGGGSSDLWQFPDYFTDHVQTVIVDDTRRGNVLDLYESIEDEVGTYDEFVVGLTEDLHSLNQNPDATDQEFASMVQKLLAERKKAEKKLLDARMKMVTYISGEEWKAILLTDSPGNDK